MLYVNISGERQLICSKRIKKWVEPRGVIDVDSIDEKFLGRTASVLMLKGKYDKLKKRVRKRRAARRAKKLALLSTKGPATEKKKASGKKSSLKKTVATLVKKVVSKKKDSTAVELKAQRAQLKEILTEKNKTDLMAFGSDVLGVDLKWKDKKNVILTKILNAAKKIGYKKIIRKA